MAKLKRVPIPLDQRLDDLRRGPLAVLLWGAAALGAWTLLTNQGQEVRLIGLATSVEAEVSAAVDGRIAEVLVAPFEDVLAGQVIARLDDAALGARIEATQAEIAVLEGEVAAERARLGLERARIAAEFAQRALDRDADLRRFQLDEEEPRLARLEAEVGIEGDLIERARIELRLERLEEMLGEGLAARAERDDLVLRRDRLTAEIEAARLLVAELVRSEAAAAARRARFEAEDPTPAVAGPGDESLEPLFARIRAVDLALAEIRIARAALTLTAPVTGRVRHVLGAAGQALLAGEPIATVVGAHVDSVIAYVPEAALTEIALGTRVVIGRAAAPQTTAEAVVAQVGPAVEEIPSRLWLDPRLPEYGRPVLIAGVSALALVPGEAAEIRLLD